MGSFVFEWHHPAEEVFVTGTFDDWAKTQQLTKRNGHFEKQVDLPAADKTYYYKFVVDGAWTTDHTAPKENDEAGNANNVLTPENIAKIPTGGRSASGSHDTPVTAGTGLLSGVGAGATSLGLAGQQPLEKDLAANDDKMPGAFPDPTPMEEAQDSNEKAFGVNPIPASSGIGNPVTLAPGEPVPQSSTISSGGVESNVTLDKESYEKSDAGIIGGSTLLGAGAGGAAAAFGLPPVTNSTIPESSLPVGTDATELETDKTPTIQSAGAGTSTAALAGQVPMEPRGVPQVVEDSQASADAPPEASASSEAVEEKREVEEELKSKVPEEPATSEGTASGGAATTTSDAAAADDKKENQGWIAGAIAGGTAAVGALGALAVSASQKAGVPQSIQDKIQDMNASATPTKTAEDVPDPVSDSIAQAHADPEAAANPEAVTEKSAVESELMSEVKRSDATGEPAPTMTASHSLSAPTVAETAGAGVVAGGLVGAGAGAVAAESSKAEEPSARVTDPNEIPSSDPNIMIADEDTMPAIAAANGSALPADEAAPSSTVPASAETVPSSATYGTTETATQQSTQPQTIAERALGAPVTNTTGTAPVTGTAAGVAPVAAAAAATGTTEAATTTSTESVFAHDPVGAIGTSAPAVTSSSQQLDPRTAASAFALDPLSAEDDSTGGARVVTVPAGSVPGAATSSTTGEASKENEAPAATTSDASTSAPRGGAMASALSGQKARHDSRDISPFSKGPGGQSPSTPTKTATADSERPSTSATDNTPGGDSSKSSKRRSRMSNWFSEHLGSGRKSKK